MKERQFDKQRIFISYAWDDKVLARRIEAELRSAGVQVWIDHSGIRVGDNSPKRISDALEWCNTLLLIWSDAARNSHWVEIEWTNALSLRKVIIPCVLDNTALPGILANTVWVDFRNIYQGIVQLLCALDLNCQSTTMAQPALPV